VLRTKTLSREALMTLGVDIKAMVDQIIVRTEEVVEVTTSLSTLSPNKNKP
jgi:hypothetical protein